MTQLLEINVNKKEKDHESGDIYYSIDGTVIEPGAVFTGETSKKQIKEKIQEALDDLHKQVE